VLLGIVDGVDSIFASYNGNVTERREKMYIRHYQHQ
jgi:hypothetical protein